MERSNHQIRRRGLLGVVATSAVLAGCLGDDPGENGGANGNDSGENGGTDESDGEDGNGGANESDGETDSETTGEASVPVLGDPDAAVTLEAYEDMGCPHCRRYENDGFETIREQYLEPGRIRYEYRDRTVTGAPGTAAANAAQAVFEREGNDAFWEFKSAVFDRQERLRRSPVETLRSVADSLGFDADAIAEAARQRSHSDDVSADNERGRSLGVTATPSFVIDGALASEGADISELTAQLDSALGDAAADDADPSAPDGTRQ